ncbi:MAG TPA: hypothetical protein VK567_11920, partial [Bradyrhizobium sp.]|nr:hypothetical protein [Bradyrhizobium sp.]
KAEHHTNWQRYSEGASQCPLWVISGHSGPSIALSALPPKQAFLSGSAMSALCQKQTFIGR